MKLEQTPANCKKILCSTQKLSATALSADSVYGDHGHAFLTMTLASYQILNRVGPNLVPPVHQSNQPRNPQSSLRATAPAIAKAVRQEHKANSQDAYSLIRPVQTNLRKMLLDTSNKIYWHLLCQYIILYSGCTVHQLLSHMDTTYAAFTEAKSRDTCCLSHGHYLGRRPL